MTNQQPQETTENTEETVNPLDVLPEFEDGKVLTAEQLKKLVEAIKELDRRYPRQGQSKLV